MNNLNRRCGLIIIDMQNDFVLPGAPVCVAGAQRTIPRIRQILDRFRENKWPVFHVVREYRPDGSDIEITRLKTFLEKRPFAVPGTNGCNIVEALKPVDGEYRIVKNRFSAFMNTEFDFILRRLGIEHIVICGTQLPNCVRATVFDGISYGYTVTLLTDAASAQSSEIAQANITDMRNIGVNCLSVDAFEDLIRHP